MTFPSLIWILEHPKNSWAQPIVDQKYRIEAREIHMFFCPCPGSLNVHIYIPVYSKECRNTVALTESIRCLIFGIKRLACLAQPSSKYLCEMGLVSCFVELRKASTRSKNLTLVFQFQVCMTLCC